MKYTFKTGFAFPLLYLFSITLSNRISCRPSIILECMQTNSYEPKSES